MEQRLMRANELGIRLEIVAGLPIWEPQPVYRHQKAVDVIRASIINNADLADNSEHSLRMRSCR